MDRHTHHHRLIAQRVLAWRQVRGRSGMDRHRRREAAKRAATTIAGHLRSEHQVRGNLGLLSVEELLARHSQEHAEDPLVPGEKPSTVGP